MGYNNSIPKLLLPGINALLHSLVLIFLWTPSLRPWLLEANHGPCFPKSDDHPLQKYLYYDFWQALIDNFVSPIGLNRADSPVKLFEKVG